jgi:hypothetical protein
VGFADRVLLTSVALAPILLTPAPASAQAWLPAAGEGAVSVVYHHSFVRDHLFSLRDRRDVGHIRTHVQSIDVEYGLTNRLTVRAMVPLIITRYTGQNPHRYVVGTPPDDFHQLDDGTAHAGLQDFKAEIRYGLYEFPIAIAPFASVTLPTHDYEVFAHSAIGLNMRELQVGSYVGFVHRSLDVQARLAFGYLERVAGVRRNRSSVDLEAGWVISPRARLFAFGASHFSHGGFDIPFAELSRLVTEPWWPHHDQLARASYTNVGAGATFAVTRSMSLTMSASTTARGRNTHATKYGITAGVSYSFGGGLPPHTAAPKRP